MENGNAETVEQGIPMPRHPGTPLPRLNDMADTTHPPETNRATRKERLGQVIANRMAKTIVVRVERRFRHPKFKKVVTGYKKFYAHDEKGDAKVGDRVRIEETRPLSKLKRWRLVEVVARSTGVMPVAD